MHLNLDRVLVATMAFDTVKQHCSIVGLDGGLAAKAHSRERQATEFRHILPEGKYNLVKRSKPDAPIDRNVQSENRAVFANRWERPASSAHLSQD
jgi:hypothetical protein